MRHVHWISSIALVSVVALSGCRDDGQVVQAVGSNPAASRPATQTVPSGTSIDVTLDTGLSSKSANVGDAWSGSVTHGGEALPTGSVVSGTVTGVKAARKGDRAMLDLGLASITVGERKYAVHGGTEAVIAGSPRARNLGAIAGSVGAGALIGKAVSGSGKGALIGGIIGGGVATGVVAASDGYQVVLKPGTILTFTTTQIVAVRY